MSFRYSAQSTKIPDWQPSVIQRSLVDPQHQQVLKKEWYKHSLEVWHHSHGFKVLRVTS